MRLSEAIRLGSMLKPQADGVFRHGGKSCAIGAALDAIGAQWHSDVDFEMHAIETEYPFLTRPATCPACSRLRGAWRRYREQEYDIADVIIHLNDDHCWTRQRIAEWVATIEPVLEGSQARNAEAGQSDKALVGRRA